MDYARYIVALNYILAAERDLGPLSRGERTDLLLDNMPELRDCAEAHALVDYVAEQQADEQYMLDVELGDDHENR